MPNAQMTIHNVEGAKLLKDLNFNRIFLAEAAWKNIQIKFQTGLKMIICIGLCVLLF